MALGIGILITERISAAVISDHEIVGTVKHHPEDGERTTDSLRGVPGERIVQWIHELVHQFDLPKRPEFIGIGVPGIVRKGYVEDSPNLIQLKGLDVRTLVSDSCEPTLGRLPVSLYNDADVMAA